MDTYEIAKKYEETSRALLYPTKPQKPAEKDYQSHTAYGQALDQWEADKDKWLKLVDEYHSANGRVNQSFEAEILAALGIADHPKASKLWEMAYERGHSGGYYEVAQEAERLAELLD